MKKEYLFHFVLCGIAAPYVGAALYCFFACYNFGDTGVSSTLYCLAFSLFHAPIGMAIFWKIIAITTVASFPVYLIVRMIKKNITKTFSICVSSIFALPYIFVLRRAGLLELYQYPLILITVAIIIGYLNFMNWKGKGIQQFNQGDG